MFGVPKLRFAFVIPLAAPLVAIAAEPVPSEQPSAAQRQQIERTYGMFCHYGINTFVDQEWTDGTVPPEKYAPPADLDQGIDEWVKTARDSGMRYFLCIAKHHDGFCLWDSKLTEYDVANPAVKNQLDVLGEVAKACKKYGASPFASTIHCGIATSRATRTRQSTATTCSVSSPSYAPSMVRSASSGSTAAGIASKRRIGTSPTSTPRSASISRTARSA